MRVTSLYLRLKGLFALEIDKNVYHAKLKAFIVAYIWFLWANDGQQFMYIMLKLLVKDPGIVPLLCGYDPFCDAPKPAGLCMGCIQFQCLVEPPLFRESSSQLI